MKRIIVAIDGYSSCGKSTIAKSLARYAGYTYIDTGAMYRAVALYCLRSGIMDGTHIDEQALRHVISSLQIGFCLTPDGQSVCLNGENVENLIRTLEVGNGASRISTIGFVREFLVSQQQCMGRKKGIVMDGRDIGTVVFPDAELKLFLTASPEIRAKRRFLELQDKGLNPVYEDVLRDVNDRDYRDTHRKESPLRRAEDAVVVDNGDMTREEQFAYICQIFNQRVAD